MQRGICLLYFLSCKPAANDSLIVQEVTVCIRENSKKAKIFKKHKVKILCGTVYLSKKPYENVPVLFKWLKLPIGLQRPPIHFVIVDIIKYYARLVKTL